MFLESMELKGFKSFANLTKINFLSGLVVVVGPNGSGKSNINDAFRWVLGEQSKKNLRAIESSDMIFSGSSSEKPAKQAEVSLFFNNEDKILKIDSKKVVIKRKIVRDGGSEYFINNELVRRKDVRNLFLDTGLGNIDLVVISQGSVSKITEAKPEILREIMNEASGVSKYEQQKHESFLKLDKVNENLKLFKVKFGEVEKRYEPLKKQKEVANKYLELKKQLEMIELPYLKRSLTKWYDQQKITTKNLIDSQNKANSMDFEIKNISKEITTNQQKLVNLDKSFYELQDKQLELSNKFQNIYVEGDDEKNIEKKIKSDFETIEELNKLMSKNDIQITTLEEKISTKEKELSKIKEDSRNINENLMRIDYEQQKISNREYDGIERGAKKILENKQYFGETIYGFLFDLLKFEKEYELCVNVALGKILYNIVVDNENTIKTLVNFLKSNKLGVATFIPIKQVIPKSIPLEILDILNKQDGFLNTLATNISVQNKFQNAINYAAGNILVFDNIDNALRATKLIGNRFKIVTLSGDIVFPGFVVRGGFNETKNFSQRKEELEVVKKDLLVQKKLLDEKQLNLQIDVDKLIREESTIKHDSIRLEEKAKNIEENLSISINSYKKQYGKDFDTTNITNSKIKTFKYDGLTYEQISQKINLIKIEKSTLLNQNVSLKQKDDKLREEWSNYINSITKFKIEEDNISKNIATSLEILTKDYQLTYETLMDNSLISNPTNSIEKSFEQCKKIRDSIFKLGNVNLNSIEEFIEVEKSYNELKESTSELENSKQKLMNSIDILDKEMKLKFSNTLEKVNHSLTKIFNILFNGGEARLEYTDPENILESGIEFIGRTPGKVVKNISLYSGGEKSMMALSLIFAINDVKKLPILLLDEVEAALDESNVDKFANLARKINEESTQIIITSHRPGTMERADFLYGVTMEEKGISKIVSVKLKDAISLID